MKQSLSELSESKTRMSLVFDDAALKGSQSRRELYLEIRQKALVLGLTRLHKIH